MVVKGFTYAGVRMDNVFILEKKQPYWAPKSNELVTVPGRPGAVFMRQQTEVLTIPLTVLVDSVPGVPFHLTVEEFAAWLNGYEEPQPLVFDSQPDRTYFAILDGEVDVDQIVQYAKVGITFVCPDPYKYSDEKTVTISAGGVLPIGGTVETKPVIEVTMKGPTSYVAVGNGDQINMIGRSAATNETPVERLQRIVWDEADTISGWVPATSSEEGKLDGTMASSGAAFYASSYGTGSSWHGPALKRGIPEALTDFQVDALVELMNLSDYKAKGKIVVTGLDASNRIVFSMQMADGFDSPRNHGIIRAADLTTGKNIISHYGEPPAWNDFKGRLRIGRIGNMWYAFIARYDFQSDKNTVRMYRSWRSNGAQYNRTLTQIQVQLMSYGSAPVARPRFEDLKVYKVNDLTANEIPIIANTGDVITFDHQQGTITKDGDDMTPEKAFIGEYFGLRPGQHPIVAEPAGSIESVRVRWRDKWH